MSDRPIERWKKLRAEGGGDGVLEVPSIDSGVSTGFGNVRFAIGSEGQPHLLVSAAELRAGIGLSSTPKLAVTLARFTLSGKGTQFVDVRCLDRSLDPVFADLAVEILRRIEDGTPPIVSVSGTIQDFRELLRERRQVEIPHGRLLGLVGELTILERMAGYSPDAVQTWMGPYELRHDFRRAVHAVEVKTSGRSDQTKVSINGADQLAPPSGGTLALAHIRMERAEAGELSVGALYKQLLGHGVDGDTCPTSALLGHFDVIA